MKQIKLLTWCFFAFFLSPAYSADFPITDLPGAAVAPGAASAIQPPPAGVARQVNVSSGFDGTEPVIPGGLRINRNGVISTCANGKTFPGTFPTVGALYDEHTFFNNGPASCVTVTFDVGTCGAAAHATAYAGTFNPNDISQNYLGDLGLSVTGPFSFIAPANSPVVIVVNSNFGPVVCDYSIDSFELAATQIPVFTPIGLLATIFGLYWFGRQRKLKLSK